MTTPALELRGVSYRYAGAPVEVLHDLDLAVAPGETVGLMGPNDAGKSTLCLVAAGLAPNVIAGRLGGEVRLAGQPTTKLLPHEAAARCGLLFQNPETQLSGTTTTVWEEVAFGPRNLGLPIPEIVERVESALDAIGIADLAPRDPERLSGGQAQLVALASVLALRPPVLVLDEPTSLLDPVGTRLVGDALSRLARQSGTAVLLVEHKADLLAELADRVVVLDQGRVVLDGPARSILDDRRLPGLGIDPPAAVTIRRLAATAGVADRIDDATLALAARLSVAVPAADGAPAPSVAVPSDRSATPAIHTTGVGFVYPDGTRALDVVDLAIGEGERLAIVGQNGSGKSTLVRHLNGLLRPTTGSVAIRGITTAGRHVAELAREVGLAFQNPDRQVFSGRVGDEVAFGPRNLGRSRPEIDTAVDESLSWVDLAGERDRNPFDLGFSRRKLLTIASILAMRTPIVVLDEPTTGQDARGLARVTDVVRRLHDDGRTVLAISHDMPFVAASFDRVVVMRAGGIRLDGTTGAVFASDRWPTLAGAHLDPPFAARLGAALGLGSTPTPEALVGALRSGGGIPAT